MTRLVPLALGATAMLAVAACGSSTSASATGARSSASPQNGRGNGFRRDATAGELVRITGTSLLLNTQTGDVTVDFTSSTPVMKTRTGTVADITAGTCVNATGQRDSAGLLTASTVIVNATTNGTCANPDFGGGGFQRSPGASPFPSRSPRPGVPPMAFARGEVKQVSGTSVTLAQMTGSTVTITVPTTVRVSVVLAATTADLGVGDCVLATGAKNSAGVVTARSLSVVPPGPSGCFTGGGGRFGRGGFFGGGAGDGGAPPGA